MDVPLNPDRLRGQRVRGGRSAGRDGNEKRMKEMNTEE